ncbi:guanine deaminase [Paraliobacillus ryukyuensis]|uniref:Guanine deaminase n=1 Tax=Paraliobacillus ryukyuensis TaxID=200904 RepID=A0A366EG43_9BACI|nr:nucleoside deaminase [Paraliobacillus ryukyuensis]RBP00710.1 guanine deaminase [Paraliobacillus ryukyuensis]
MENHLNYMKQAISLAVDNVHQQGGPFGAIIVNAKGEIVGKGQNRVTDKHDPTAHAEVEAIRQACQALGTFQLDDCILYTSCEPCPMCLGAIYWARLKKVYYAADQALAATGGFDDAFIYQEINKPYEERKIPFYELDVAEKNAPFETWKSIDAKIEY